MNHLGLFAKYWEPGQVKTRLAADVGELAACRIYEAFVRHLLDKLGQAADSRSLAFSPSDRAAEFANAAGHQWLTQPQSNGDLGTRMAAFFDSCWDTSQPGERTRDPASQTVKRVVLVGTDCPHLTNDLVDAAFAMLAENDIVLGPCPDGGYFLVGMNAPHTRLFENIDWSSDRVLRQTLERTITLDLKYTLLNELTDIDHLSDLRHVIQETKTNGSQEDQSLFESIRQWLPEN